MCLRLSGCGKEEDHNSLDFHHGKLTHPFICYRCLVVPMRWPIDSSISPKADPVLSLSEPLASLSLRDDLESSSSTYM